MPKKEYLKVICEQCKKELYLVPWLAKKTKFCSRRCAYDYRIDNKRINYECPQCKKIIKVPPARIKYKKYCSLQCKADSQKNKPTWNKGIKGYNTSWKGGKHSDIAKNKMSKSSMWNKNRHEAYKIHFKNKKNVISKYELYFEKKLIKKGLLKDKDYFMQYVIKNKYQVDFFVLPNIIYEINGEFHYKKGKLIDKDQKRSDYITKLGYNLIHIKNKEVDNYVI